MDYISRPEVEIWKHMNFQHAVPVSPYDLVTFAAQQRLNERLGLERLLCQCDLVLMTTNC